MLQIFLISKLNLYNGRLRSELESKYIKGKFDSIVHNIIRDIFTLQLTVGNHINECLNTFKILRGYDILNHT